jgi:hypothetical protein
MASTSSTDPMQEMRSKFAQLEEMVSTLTGVMVEVRAAITNQSTAMMI